MSVSYEWSFPQSDTIINQDGLQDVVTTVHWVLTASEDNFTASCYGSVGLDPADANNFTAFADLTKEQITEWVVAKINAQRRPGPNGQSEEGTRVDQMKAGLTGQIEKQKAPVTASKGFAFSA